MVFYYPYKQSFSGERPLAQRNTCYHIKNRVPKRQWFYLCHLLQNHVLSGVFVYEGKNLKGMSKFHELV